MASSGGVGKGNSAHLKPTSGDELLDAVFLGYFQVGWQLVSDVAEKPHANKPKRNQNVDENRVIAAVHCFDDIQITGQFLESSGWNVLIATNGEQTLEQIYNHKNEISAVLLDVVLPEMGAAGVLGQLSIAAHPLWATYECIPSDRETKLPLSGTGYSDSFRVADLFRGK